MGANDPGELIERLRRVDACAVSDACDRLGLGDCVVAGIIPLTGPVHIAGRAITVELGPVRPAASGVHLCAAATDASGPEHVIVVAHQARTDCAGWGGNLSRGARRRGCAGTLVDGAVRDVDEAIEIGYPVFARGATPRTARARTQEHAWGGTVTFAGVEVASGDYVIADTTGVVFVGADDMAAVLDAAEAIANREAAMAADIDAGRPVSEVMGGSYERMLER